MNDDIDPDAFGAAGYLLRPPATNPKRWVVMRAQHVTTVGDFRPGGELMVTIEVEHEETRADLIGSPEDLRGIALTILGVLDDLTGEEA